MTEPFVDDILEKDAISAVRHYLISLLVDDRWCRAKVVGRALEILIGEVPRDARPQPPEGQRMRGGETDAGRT